MGSDRRHTGSDRIRSHRAGQQKIKHYCSCGRMVVGNPGWASHQRANPDHSTISQTRFLALNAEAAHWRECASCRAGLSCGEAASV